MQDGGGEESRRYPRLPARCRVRIRDRFGVWDAQTEDVGPRGCRLVTARPQSVGALVSLSVQAEGVSRALEVAGQIVWAQAERPARAGVSFAGGPSLPDAISPGVWFESVRAVQQALEEAAAEIVIEVEGPIPEPATLVDRLTRRALQLLGNGDRTAAELFYRRALSLAPDDAGLVAALRALAAR